MKRLLNILFLLIVSGVIYISCKKSYSPPAINIDYRYLTIDGSLINSVDSPSVITLSRTARLTDSSLAYNPETGATVSVEDSAGGSFAFAETGGGRYRSNPLSLNPSDKYRLKITTSSGEDYVSDYVAVKQTPPIDSVTWQQNNDVMIYLYTHDPSNDTKYYRWDFTETWQYEAPLQAELSQTNGVLFYVDATDQTFDCWRSLNSSAILVGTSIALNQDVINKAPITIVQQNTQKISIRYSILVRQYAIAPDAYQYFSVLKKNSENLGSIFDAQPTQLVGNIHSVKNPSEVVVGFFTASSVQQQRIFISKYQVSNWNFVDSNAECKQMTIDHAPLPNPEFYVYDYPDTSYYPYYFCGASCLTIAKRECVDCRLKGGVNQKPSYW